MHQDPDLVTEVSTAFLCQEREPASVDKLQVRAANMLSHGKFARLMQDQSKHGAQYIYNSYEFPSAGAHPFDCNQISASIQKEV